MVGKELRAARAALGLYLFEELRHGPRVIAGIIEDLRTHQIRLPLRISDALPRGVVCTLKGAWLATSDNGQTVSALCPAHHADISEGACFNDARVEVAAV